MIPFASFFIPFKWLWGNKEVVAVVAVIVIAGLGWHLALSRKTEIESLGVKLEEANAIIKTMEANHKAVVGALERKVESDKDRNNFEKDRALKNAEGRINGDGPLAPVLRDGLRSLAERQHKYNNTR